MLRSATGMRRGNPRPVLTIISVSSVPKESVIQVFVRDNNVDQALKVLKKKLQREGIFRELRRRRAYEKPSERRAREAGEAVRRLRKQARKRAEREGLIAAKPRARSRRR